MAEQELPEIKLDRDNLYREEQISDLRAGSIRRLTPVKADGSDDEARPVLFEGHANLMTPAGALPINFPIEVASLNEALDQFPELAKKAIEDTLEELQRLRREQQSSIMVPGQGQGGGGMPGGGIQMP
ncbi:MAG: hypothetical protein R3352_10255 [Salinisphaeraceae bacterium]|nr:hypothetical protein [Salinisphaeraceae bacterium]